MTKEEKMEMAGTLFKCGMPMQKIAEQLDCSISTVSKYIAELGIRTKRAKGLEERVIELHIKGYNSKQIAYQLDCSQTYVFDKLREAGFGRHYTKYEENLINADTVYAKDWNARPLEKLTMKEKWSIKNGVMQRLVHHYTDITPIFSPR